jgi:hypothetical protein
VSSARTDSFYACFFGAGCGMARQSHRLNSVPGDAHSMLIHADNRGVDHLDGGIIGSGDRVHDIASTRQPAASERSDCSKWSLYRTKYRTNFHPPLTWAVRRSEWIRTCA